MTAKIAILNRSAVAIATDSAVTLGLSDPKVFNSFLLYPTMSLTGSWPEGLGLDTSHLSRSAKN